MSSRLIATDANQKLRGGYYTPEPIADFLAAWAIRDPSAKTLDPSCGDGVLLAASARRLMSLGAPASELGSQLFGIELYESEADSTVDRLRRLGIDGAGTVKVGDFFSFDDQEWGIVNEQFDVIIGNPPFLKYHTFPEDQRQRAFRIMRTAGLRPNRLTNSWLAFLIAASLRLRTNGRLAMVIPAELLQVNYAAEARAFLARHFGAITIITFRRLVFDSILQEVVLLLAEKTPAIQSGIDVVELTDAGDLADYEVTLRSRQHLKPIDHAEEKWTQYYLDEDEIDLLREASTSRKLTKLGQIGCVDVGVVTGNNGFFVMNEAAVQSRGLSGLTVPLVGRTSQLPSLVLTTDDWTANRDSGVACHLLNLPALPFEALTPTAQSYVLYGESQQVHEGYKCSIRKPWYVSPGPWIPDAFLFRQIYAYPKLVWNCASATSTDTIHRVRCKRPEIAPQLTVCFLNSMTFAFAEALGRSYGGGVLELEPNEAEELPIPFLETSDIDIEELAVLERSNQIETILEITDRRLLRDSIGFDAADVARFRRIWRKLSSRRLGRKAAQRRVLP